MTGAVRWIVAVAALVAVAVAWPAPAPIEARGHARADGAPHARAAKTCSRPRGVQSIEFSRAKYPRIRRHFRKAVRRGWPKVLVVNRGGADARRDRLMRGYPTRAGHDRDEYPPAVGRGRGKGLSRGRQPRGWKADVAYVGSSENRSHGATLGNRLRPFCNGTRFRYLFE
jgi:hypothetical protein